MDARRFDTITKALAANRASRRSVLALLAGVVAGGPRSAARPAGPTTARGAPSMAAAPTPDSARLPRGQDAVSRCPACGDCQTCGIEAATSVVACGAPCADPCLASALCAAANGDAAFRQLADALAADGFAPVGAPAAIAVETDGALLVERLAAEYDDSEDPNRTATLVFLREPGGNAGAYAVVFDDKIPLHGLVIDEGSRVVQVDMAPAGDGTDPGAGVVVQAAAPCTGCDACDIVCDVADPVGKSCNALGLMLCQGKPVVCAAVEIACALVAYVGCDPFCELFGCAVCDQYCQNRSEGCTSCVDHCQAKDSNSRCVDGRCRCVAGDRIGQACEPPDRCVDGICRCVVGNAEGETCGPKGGEDYCCDTRRCERCHLGRCLGGCQSHQACCNGECRDDWVECGETCCPFLEGLICCGAGCVNPELNRNHCGACNSRCSEEEICDRGRCRGCDPSLCETYDDGRCVVGCGEDEVCEPMRGCVPREDEPIELSVCETWLSNADLLALVAGATDVTSLTSFEAENERGNLAYLCLWDVVGNPQDAEPWFDWLVKVQAALTLRVDEPADSWAASLNAFEADLGCALVELPEDGTTVCLREDSDALDLVARPGADSVLWLALTSSTTAGVPDYQSLRVAAEGIASLLVARLAPPPR